MAYVFILVTGQNPPDMCPLDTNPQDTYPGSLTPWTRTPRTYTPPPNFKMGYLVYASCVDNILHFKKHLFCRNSIYL